MKRPRAKVAKPTYTLGKAPKRVSLSRPSLANPPPKTKPMVGSGLGKVKGPA